MTELKAVKKPQDHKAGKDDIVRVEYGGVKFDVRKGILSKLRVIRALERNQFITALELILSEESFDEYLDANPEADAEDAAKLLELVAEEAGAKNS